MDNIIIAFMLTLIAGLCTGIGSVIAFLAKKTNRRFLSVSLGFSAGVMVYVSFVEIFRKSETMLTAQLGERYGAWCASGAFFMGIILIAVIDRLIPEGGNPHEVKEVLAETCTDDTQAVHKYGRDAVVKDNKLLRMGAFTALAIAVHNFPEGLATFVSALQEPSVAIPIVVAIAIHNIPEGIAVAVPIYQATGSKKKAFWYSFASGLAEPVGAIAGWLLLMPVMNDVVYGVIFGVVSGIMVFISVDELLPAAREYGASHMSIYGMVAGMAVMSVSLLLLM